MELRRFFDRAVRSSFRDLALHDEPVATYLGDLLTRFARTEQLFPPGASVPRLETVVDVLLEAQAVWDDFLAGRTGWARPWSLYVLNDWVRRRLTAVTS